MKCKWCGNEALEGETFESLCEPCFLKKLNVAFLEMERRGLIERTHGDYRRITEKGRQEKDSWNEAWEAAEPPAQSSSTCGQCIKCGKTELIGYSYRSKYYCHECFRPIVDMVNEADRETPKRKPDDYVFWPAADEETRRVMASWTMADALLKMDRPDTAYAWLKCGFVRPGIMENAKIKPYRIPRDLRHDEVLHWNTPSRLTDDESLQWENAITEYRKRSETTIPQSEQWAMVYKLKNGETCVADKRGYIEVVGYETAKDFVNIFGKLKPGTIAYTVAGLRGSMEHLGENGILAIGCQAVPRTDYEPKKHDTFHLRLGPGRRSEAVKASLDLMQAMGLLVDFKRPSSAFDVMSNLAKVCEHAKGFQLLTILQQAHPIVWTPQMTGTAYQAVCELNEPLKVESDLMFLEPALWLYTVPCYEGCPAERATDPFTDDGHVPFPDEVVGDLGAPIIAILFHLTNTEIRASYFYLLREEPAKVEIRSTHLKLGSQPTEIAEQTTLKWLRFAASPYLIVTQYHVERHVRRRVQNRFPLVSSGVGVILLRRAERLYEARGGDEVGVEVNWSYQWWVSGHWRSLRHPRFKSHNPVWIAPYIKGPPDKPLKDSVRLMVR